MEAPSSNLTCSSDDDSKNLKWLLEAFGSMASLDEMASAYCQAGRDVHKAGDILSNMRERKSTPLTNGDKAASSTEAPQIPSRRKARKHGVSMGTVTGVIGSDYARSRISTIEGREKTKPVKLMSSEFPVSEIWDDKMQTNNAKRLNNDVEEFLLQMLGNGFQLDREVIKEVVGGCGYDVKESMEKLLNMSAPTLDLNTTSSKAAQTSVEKCPDLNKGKEKLQSGDSAGRFEARHVTKSESEHVKIVSNRPTLEAEVLNSLFTVPGRSEDVSEKILPRRIARSRTYGLVDGPIKDTVTEFKTPVVKKEDNGHEHEENEDNFVALREAAKEYWITMKQYYRAAADAFTKGNHARASKLIEEGHFYMNKAREANEKSAKKLLQSRDDGETISIDVRDYEPKDAVRLLKSQLKLMSGIPSYHYLKVIVGATEDSTKQRNRKRLISKLLERDAIAWTEEQDGQIIAIRLDVINPKRLSFNKD